MNSPTKPSAISIAYDFIMYNVRDSFLERYFSQHRWSIIQFKCCGVYNGTDLLDPAAQWNKTNPWWTSSMDNSTRTFKYPITCCNIGNVFRSDWNNLPADDLKNFSNCAISGNGVYQDVCCQFFLSSNYLSSFRDAIRNLWI